MVRDYFASLGVDVESMTDADIVEGALEDVHKEHIMEYMELSEERYEWLITGMKFHASHLSIMATLEKVNKDLDEMGARQQDEMVKDEIRRRRCNR